MTASLPRWMAAGLLAVTVGALPLAQTTVPPEGEPAAAASSSRPLLDAIRDDLVGLRFEEALAAIEALLGDPGLSEAERGEALVLRSQAHVAFGDLDAAEQDYREILRMRPGFIPDTALTPRKAAERFQRARAALIGDLILEIQPTEARVFVDDRPLTFTPGAKVPLVAGDHVVRAEQDGFDSLRQTVRVEANQDGRLELSLVPNARTVVVLTEPEGVDVTLDGVWIGRTVRPPHDDSSGAARGAARLEIEHLSLGEHVFELSMGCFRSASIRDLLTVDLLDWTPKTYPLVSLVPVRSTLLVRGGPAGADVHVDDEFVTRLPADPVEVCPGERRLAVRLGSRRIWSRSITVTEAEEAVIQVEPRPNAVLLGVGSWPPELRAFAEPFNATIQAPPARGVDLSVPTGWDRLGLPDDVDLAVAAGPARQGEPAWWLYSPVLRVVAPFDSVAAAPDRPRWMGVSWGLSLVDSARSGPALVVHVAPEGPAFRAGLRPGDRLISLGGSQVVDSVQARRILGIASMELPLNAEWLSPDGTAHRGRLSGVPTMRLVAEASSDAAAVVRAAWAVVDAASDEKLAPAATSNLALLLGTYGRHERAVRAWRRVELADRAGIGRGTVQYYLGRELGRLGAEAEAIQAHRAAAAGEATAFDDEGPRIAPAARDHLADFGVQ